MHTFIKHVNGYTIRHWTLGDVFYIQEGEEWIITYLFHTGSDLLKPLNQETEVEVYSNSYSAINIFNKIGVRVEEKNRYLD